MQRIISHLALVHLSMAFSDLVEAHSISYVLQRCVGFMMAKMVLRELMEPSTFAKFKSFLTKVFKTLCLVFLLYHIHMMQGNMGLGHISRN